MITIKIPDNQVSQLRGLYQRMNEQLIIQKREMELQRDKINKDIEGVELKLTEIRNIISQLNPASENRETNSIVKDDAVKFLTPENGYNPSFTWKEKILYVLNHANKAMKAEDIVNELRRLDFTIKNKSDLELRSSFAPMLSILCREGEVVKGKIMGELGLYYISSVFFDGHKLKPDFKSMIDSNMRILIG